MSDTYDGMCEEVIARCGLNGAVPWVLMASCAYYCGDGTFSVLSDGLFDRLCKDLLAGWEGVTHRHKPLIREDDLRAGSLNGLALSNYPTTVRAALFALVGRAGISEALQAQFDYTPFTPPAWAMDTYVYGLDERGRPLTWRQYQDHHRTEVRGNIARVRERVRSEAVVVAPQAPQGGQEVIARVRQRPTSPVPPAPPPVAATVRARERVRPS